MPQNFLACDREQELLLPPSLREWLPASHLAWFVLDAVEAFDLGAFYAAYSSDNPHVNERSCNVVGESASRQGTALSRSALPVDRGGSRHRPGGCAWGGDQDWLCPVRRLAFRFGAAVQADRGRCGESVDGRGVAQLR